MSPGEVAYLPPTLSCESDLLSCYLLPTPRLGSCFKRLIDRQERQGTSSALESRQTIGFARSSPSVIRAPPCLKSTKWGAGFEAWREDCAPGTRHSQVGRWPYLRAILAMPLVPGRMVKRPKHGSCFNTRSNPTRSQLRRTLFVPTHRRLRDDRRLSHRGPDIETGID